MKLVLALLLLAGQAMAGNYILMKADGQFRARDGIVLTLKAGECFPLVEWDRSLMGARMRVGGESCYQFWYDIRTVFDSPEVQGRYEAALRRISAEHTVAVAAREAERKESERKRLAAQQKAALEDERRAAQVREAYQQYQLDSIEAALWQIAGQRR